MDTGNTGFMMICTALVFIMTPGLAFFYGGLVRRKNVCSTMMACVAIMGLSVVMWTLFGYSLAFGGNHGGISCPFRLRDERDGRFEDGRDPGAFPFFPPRPAFALSRGSMSNNEQGPFMLIKKRVLFTTNFFIYYSATIFTTRCMGMKPTVLSVSRGMSPS